MKKNIPLKLHFNVNTTSSTIIVCVNKSSIIFDDYKLKKLMYFQRFDNKRYNIYLTFKRYTLI